MYKVEMFEDHDGTLELIETLEGFMTEEEAEEEGENTVRYHFDRTGETLVFEVIETK